MVQPEHSAFELASTMCATIVATGSSAMSPRSSVLPGRIPYQFHSALAAETMSTFILKQNARGGSKLNSNRPSLVDDWIAGSCQFVGRPNSCVRSSFAVEPVRCTFAPTAGVPSERSNRPRTVALLDGAKPEEADGEESSATLSTSSLSSAAVNAGVIAGAVAVILEAGSDASMELTGSMAACSRHANHVGTATRTGARNISKTASGAVLFPDGAKNRLADHQIL